MARANFSFRDALPLRIADCRHFAGSPRAECPGIDTRVSADRRRGVPVLDKLPQQVNQFAPDLKSVLSPARPGGIVWLM